MKNKLFWSLVGACVLVVVGFIFYQVNFATVKVKTANGTIVEILKKDVIKSDEQLQTMLSNLGDRKGKLSVEEIKMTLKAFGEVEGLTKEFIESLSNMSIDTDTLIQGGDTISYFPDSIDEFTTFNIVVHNGYNEVRTKEIAVEGEVANLITMEKVFNMNPYETRIIPIIINNLDTMSAGRHGFQFIYRDLTTVSPIHKQARYDFVVEVSGK